MVNYESRIQVENAGHGARVVWTGHFDASDHGQSPGITEAIAATYREGLEALRLRIEAT